MEGTLIALDVAAIAELSILTGDGVSSILGDSSDGVFCTL